MSADDGAHRRGAAIATLARGIGAYRLPISDEIRLHQALDRVLAELLPGERVLPEHRFDEFNRIDYFLPDLGIGLEVKVKGSPGLVRRQLRRYAAIAAVQHLVLIASRHTLLSFHGVTAIDGTPFTLIFLSVGFL